MRVGDQRRIDRRLDHRPFSPFVAGDQLDHPQQFDRVAQFRGKFHVRPPDGTDALDVHLPRRNPKAVRQRGEDADLVLRIGAANVQRRIGLRVAQPLRLLQSRREVQALQFHPCQYIIAGAVDDAVKVCDAVAHKTLAQRLDDRDAPGDAGLVIEIGSELPGRGEQLRAVLEKERLVGRDHRFAQPQRRQDHRPGEGCAPDQLDDHLDSRVVHHRRPIR